MNKMDKSNFIKLIGNWKTEGTIFNDKGNSELIGTDTYEFILEDNFILHKAEVKMGNEKSETYEIFELTDATEKAKMQYFNSKGENGMMTSSIKEDNYKINGEKIKFEGIFINKNKQLIGKWYLETSTNEWIKFIDMKLTKQN